MYIENPKKGFTVNAPSRCLSLSPVQIKYIFALDLSQHYLNNYRSDHDMSTGIFSLHNKRTAGSFHVSSVADP